MTTASKNDDTECEVCFDEKSVHIPLFTCTHSHTFCEKCIKIWLTEAHPTCPKCRRKLPIQNYLKTTGQTGVNIADSSITIEYDSLLSNNLSPSNSIPLANDSSRTTSCSDTEILYCLLALFIVILGYLFIYWLSTKIENNG